jgi:hypothetical protein
MEHLVKNKLSPIEEKVNQLRADLNLLTDAVDEQNKTLEIIANSKAHSCQEL